MHLTHLLSFFILALLSIEVFSQMSAKKSRKYGSFKHAKRRGRIIKCCGADKCLTPTNKKQPKTNITQPRNPSKGGLGVVHLSKPKDRSPGEGGSPARENPSSGSPGSSRAAGSAGGAAGSFGDPKQGAAGQSSSNTAVLGAPVSGGASSPKGVTASGGGVVDEYANPTEDAGTAAPAGGTGMAGGGVAVSASRGTRTAVGGDTGLAGGGTGGGIGTGGTTSAADAGAVKSGTTSGTGSAGDLGGGSSAAAGGAGGINETVGQYMTATAGGANGTAGGASGTAGGGDGTAVRANVAAGEGNGTSNGWNGTAGRGNGTAGSSNGTASGHTGNSTSSPPNSTTLVTNSSAGTGNSLGVLSENSTSNSSSTAVYLSESSNATSSTTPNYSTSKTVTSGCKKPSCDPSVFARRRRRVAPAAATGQDGSFSRSCNKSYFFGSNPVSWAQSYTECQKFGMVSIGVGTPEKQKCVNDAANSNPKSADKKFWTSGHKKNATCKKTYAMCDANEVIGPDIANLLAWAPMMGENPDTDLCITLAMMAGATNGLSHAFCENKLNIMCEPKCVKPTCPIKCTPDGTWPHGWDFCCSLGMKLAGFETKAETDALAAAVKGKSGLATDYWISASQLNCVGTWSFCGTDTVYEKSIEWMPGQPDNYLGAEDYVSLVIDTVRGAVTMNDRNVDQKFPYACESI